MLAVASACFLQASDFQEGSPSALFAVRDSSTLRIQLTRGACFDSCPDYTVSIDGKGNVAFNGRASVGMLGIHQARISRQQLQMLLRSFERADFFSLENEYTAPVTDLPLYVVSIEFDGRKKHVFDYGGEMIGMPRIITELKDAIDQAADTARWVKK